MLEYDNSAFYYFALTLLVIYIIPGTWYAVAEFFRAFLGSGDVGSKPRTAQEKEKAAKLKKETTGITRLNTNAYITNLVCVVIAWAVFLYLVALVSRDGEVSTFDPYAILGIEQGAAVSVIKKAYRKLSLKYHPDKNIGDKFAEEMFMKIAKAYESLTDETARENLEKYGNPDGKQALEVSIGLPKILLENPKVVLVLYLIGMVVVIPAAVGYWYSNSKQYGEKNIMYETYNTYYTIIQENYRMKNLPEVIAASAEARAINVPKPTDNEPMGKLYAKLKSENRMIKPNYEQPAVLRGNLLLHAYLLRMTNTLNPVLLKDLSDMLARTPELIDGIIEISHQRKWLETSISALKFSQCLIQALWSSNNSLEQLPHLTSEDIKSIITSPTKNGKAQARNLGEYLQIPDDDKKGLNNLTKEQKDEVLKVCSLIPKLKVDYKLFVEEEEQDFLGDEDGKKEEDADEDDVPQIKGDSIYEQDLVTLRVTLTRENITDAKGKASPVHAPFFPKTIRENWWLILTDKPQRGPDGVAKRTGEASIHAFEKVFDQGRVVSHEIRFMAPPRVGTYEMELQVISDCYLGLDQTFPIVFTVLPAAELPEYAPHPEDKDLDNEPTLFEQVMAANQDDDSSDDEDEPAEEEKKGKTSTNSNKTVTKPGNGSSKNSGAVVVEDVDDSEEED